MKTKIKRHSRSVLSVVLAVCMLVSCMTVGIIATDAAKMADESVGLDQGDGIHLGIGTSATTWHGMGSDAYEFTLSATTTIYYTFSCSGSNFGKGNQGTPSDSSLETYTWYANKGDSTQFSVSLPAGTYKFKLKGIQSSNANALEYQFWKVSGGSGGGEDDTTPDYIYFDNSGTNWSKVYAYLYTSSYWDTNNGSGSYNRSNGVEMTYDSALGLYKTPITSSIKYVVFLRDQQNNYSNFWQTEAAYIELSDTYANDSKFSASTPVYVPDSTQNVSKNSTRYYDTADTNYGSWVAATNPTVASLSISASPTELSAVGDTSTITVTATDIASGLTNLTYTIYDRADNSVVDTKAVTDGSASVTFTVTPDARVKSYYASVKPTSTAQQALYDEVWTSSDATVSNSADVYIPRYTVTFDSNNASYGTVTAKDGNGNAIASGASVKEGDSVTFTATPKTGYVFTSWSVFDTTATSVTRVIRADTTVTGNFGPKGYKLLAGSTVTQNMRELANGTYISEELTSDNWFIIVKNATGERSKGNASPQVLAVDGTKYDVTWMTGTTWSDSNTYKKTSGTHYVVYDPNTNKVWLTSDKDDLYGVTVVAKDGTIRYGYGSTSDYTQVFGDTTVELVSPTSITGTVDNNAYDGQAVAYNLSADDVRNGVTLKIKTQTKSEYVNQGYYVKGFVVSGYEESFSVLWQEFDDEGTELATYDDREWIHSGYNEFELTIDGYPEKNIEITPIYAIRETTSGDNIRFYVEGFAGDVYKDWGGTLAIDAFNTSGDRMFGEYPGQPMINYNGRYVVDLPRTGVTGITLNNYVWDRIHSNLFYGTTGTSTGHESTVQAVNYQTYDFNDFVYLKQKMDASGEDEDIVFSFRYKNNENYNTKETSQLGKSTYYVNSDNPSATRDYDYRNGFNTINPNDSIYQWENLTDFYGNRVDIFGDYVDTKDSSGAATNPKANYNPIRIVSNGYDYNEAGNYATAWAVYKPVDASGNLKYEGDYDHYELFEVYGGQGKSTYGSSSYLVNPTWTENLRWKYDQAYRTAHASETPKANFVFDLAEVPTVISYEYQVKDGFSNLNLEVASGDGDPGYRSDGRWFTTSSDQLLTAHTIIEYAEKDEESAYHRDYYQGNGIDYTSASGYDPTLHTGIATGIQAYFDNSESVSYQGQSFQNTSGNTEAYAISDGEHEFNLKAVGDPDGEYMFKGWYMYTNGKYSLVSRSETYSSEATANDVYVARYYKVPSGTLNVTHNLHPDSTGTADCYAKVEVMNGSNVVFTYAETTDGIKVTSAHMKSDSNNTLKITLRTVTDSQNGFESFNMKLSDTIEALAATGVLASVSTIDTSTPNEYKVTIQTVAIKNFFDNTGSQTTKALPFYSLLNQKNFAHTKILYSPDRYVSDGIDDALDTYGVETVLSAFSRDYYQSGDIDWKSASGYDKTDVTGLNTETQAYMTSGGNNVTELEFNANDVITLNAADTPAANNSRYSFVGWFVQKTDGSIVKLSNSYTTAANTYTAAADDKDLVFIAVFEPVLTYSIKYTYDSTHYGSQYYLVTGTFTAQEIATYLVWSNTDSSAEGLDGSYSYKADTKTEFFAAKSPYEKNVGKSFQWEFTNDTTAHYSANHQLSSTVPSHNGTDTTRKIQFVFPYRVKNTDSGTETQTTDGKVYIVPDGQSYKDKDGQYSRYLNIYTATYGQPYELNWQDTATGDYLSNYITAEEKIFDSNNDEYHFAYWSIQNIPVNVRTSDPAEGAVTEYDKQVEVARCYNLGFNFTIYQDYIVEPKYIKSTSSIAKTHSNSATIAFTEYGRNQWNANGGGTTVPTAQKTQGDKIFLQFMAAFDRADMTRLDSQTAITAGILYERLDALTAEQKANVPSPADLFTTYGGKDSTHGKEAAISAVASTNNTTVGKAQYAIMKLDTAEKLQKIDNKNRIAIEQGVTHKNNQGVVTGYANYIYRAYAYMVEEDGTVTISDQPVYFTFYKIANMADGSSEG